MEVGLTGLRREEGDLRSFGGYCHPVIFSPFRNKLKVFCEGGAKGVNIRRGFGKAKVIQIVRVELGVVGEIMAEEVNDVGGDDWPLWYSGVTFELFRFGPLEMTDCSATTEVAVQLSHNVGMESGVQDFVKEQIVIDCIRSLGDVQKHCSCTAGRLALIEVRKGRRRHFSTLMAGENRPHER
jgi:hypothetical protein